MRRLTISLLVLIGFLFSFHASSFAAAPPSGTATFLGTDTTTLGNWTGTYGTVGSYIPNGPSVTPTDGSTFNAGAASLFTWGTNVASGSALKTGVGTDIASCWYKNLGNASPSLTLDVDVTSGSQTVALYLLDYDKQGRSESVSVTDASNNALDGPHAVSGTNFANGEYLSWSITGEVHITITLVNGPNAVASGIFFGESATMPPPVAVGAYFDKAPTSSVNPSQGPTVGELQIPAGTYIIHANLAIVRTDNSATPVTISYTMIDSALTPITGADISLPPIASTSTTTTTFDTSYHTSTAVTVFLKLSNGSDTISVTPTIIAFPEPSIVTTSGPVGP